MRRITFYNNLNGLFGKGTFPNIENRELNFIRTTDVDTRISLIHQVWNSWLLVRYKIQNERATMVGEDLSISNIDAVWRSKTEVRKAVFQSDFCKNHYGVISSNLSKSARIIIRCHIPVRGIIQTFQSFINLFKIYILFVILFFRSQVKPFTIFFIFRMFFIMNYI